MDKAPFDKVADNAVNQQVVLTENMKFLQSKHKELFLKHKKMKNLLPPQTTWLNQEWAINVGRTTQT